MTPFSDQSPRPSRKRALAAVLAFALMAPGCAQLGQDLGGVFERPNASAEQRTVEAAAAAVAREDFGTAEELLNRAVEQHTQRFEPGDGVGVSLLILLAETYIRTGRFDQAESLATRALVLAEPVGPLNADGTQRSAHFRLARAYESMARDGDAERHYYKALQTCQEAPGYDERAECNGERGPLVRLFVTAGRYEEAEPLVLRTLATTQMATGPYDLRLSYALGEAAEFYRRQGKYELSEPLFGRALALWRSDRDAAYEAHVAALEAGEPTPLPESFTRIRPSHFPFAIPFGLDEQPRTLEKLDRPDQAARAMDVARQLWGADTISEQAALERLAGFEARGERSREALLAEATLGLVYYHKGRYSRAERHLGRVVLELNSIWANFDPLERRDTLDVYLDALTALGRVASESDRHRAAVAQYDRALLVAGRNLDRHDARHLDRLADLAEIHRANGDLDHAAGYARRYLSMVRESRGEVHPDYAWALRKLAYIEYQRGGIDRSRRLQNDAAEIWSQTDAVLPDF